VRKGVADVIKTPASRLFYRPFKNFISATVLNHKVNKFNLSNETPRAAKHTLMSRKSECRRASGVHLFPVCVSDKAQAQITNYFIYSLW